MSYRVRYTVRAQADLQRLYEFILFREDFDARAAEQALKSIKDGMRSLEISPFSFRKSSPDNPFLRELVIPFGAAGYVALFEIDDQKTVTVLALRHQLEDDYH